LFGYLLRHFAVFEYHFLLQVISDHLAIGRYEGIALTEAPATNPSMPTPTAIPAAPRRFWLVIAVALIVGVLAATWAVIDSQNVRPYVAPDFALTTYDGQIVHLADLRGKVVVLNFWASWCAPCRAEAPVLNLLSQQEKDTVFVGVAQGDTEANARAYLKEFTITYPNGPDNGIVDAYRVQGLPTTIVISPTGVVTETILAGVEPGKLRASIEAARGK
jgi:cytochrome c biogenesis protein CcmG/thiol:disulfide interchange protein DsbE